ncbi:PHB depolymerase family esterase [Sphingomonas sanguinis]|uniref:extracellular catalytic domain type 1 short-chain-length polyhydroxyalkanoate depolymerase n=1 Tax=Sphingomonas sp. LC-1 TaxID=3110957 RepID=UPI0021BB0C93|nr:PHB depolymerase family esterase [Sphingomonas sp. LC-1]MCT8002392.1 PHB depolymerase family esterase [Sphingomonas sp. LC-1]
MRSISDTIAHLRDLAASANLTAQQAAPLTPIDDFGQNPGALRGYLHIPHGLPTHAPLVVVLHGCTQTAGSYDHGAGWSTLADRFGFALLFPEQQRANNPNLCFNWFVPEDTRRGSGEVGSIREMIIAAVGRYELDPARVFVTGLSAGGAMTSAMLACHPELFAGGAIIAGLPFDTAHSVPEALERMRGRGHDRATLSDRVRKAAAHGGPWPTVSIWHGTADPTVDAVNAGLIVDQWRGIHGVGEPDITERIDSHSRRTWHNQDGRVVIEEYMVTGMGHGTPLATDGDEACGVPGPHMLPVGLSSTYRIAAAWGIVPAAAPARPVDTVAAVPQKQASVRSMRFDPTTTINGALRAAGLMKP